MSDSPNGNSRSSVNIDNSVIENHCMKNALFHYVRAKVHPELLTRKWNTVVVRGRYDRSSAARPIDSEKRDKPFNWHRPTLTSDDNQTAYLNCFPGRDYVEHYAGIVKTYLYLTGNPTSMLWIEYPPENAARQTFLDSNLRNMGQVDVVIVGYVWQIELPRSRQTTPEIGEQILRLEPQVDSGQMTKEDEYQAVKEIKSLSTTKSEPMQTSQDPWTEHSKDNIFAWQKFRTPRGKTVALLGCMPSFWGDISKDLIEAINELNQPECVLYIGKAGSLRPMDDPNQIMATGNSSSLADETIVWKNILEEAASYSTRIQTGHHVTIATPILESSEWYETWKDKARWVDCEIGHMAKACNRASIGFGYLHIISDNLTTPEPYNMSNERLASVKIDRRKLFQEISTVIEVFCSSYK